MAKVVLIQYEAGREDVDKVLRHSERTPRPAEMEDDAGWRHAPLFNKRPEFWNLDDVSYVVHGSREGTRLRQVRETSWAIDVYVAGLGGENRRVFISYWEG